MRISSLWRDKPRKEEMDEEGVQPRGVPPGPRGLERGGAMLVVAARERFAEDLHVLRVPGLDDGRVAVLRRWHDGLRLHRDGLPIHLLGRHLCLEAEEGAEAREAGALKAPEKFWKAERQEQMSAVIAARPL